MKKALFFEQQEEKRVVCRLCPHNCKISEGSRGICLSRVNNKGILYSENYGKILSANFDPLEKKPLYHFNPGKNILSIGTFGCNFNCRFCQNSDISHPEESVYPNAVSTSPAEIVTYAKKQEDNTGIAFTYNEPLIWIEYILDTAKLSHENGLKNVLVSNGFLNAEPFKLILQQFDAFNIDLKSFNSSFYKNFVSGNIEPVKSRIIDIKKAGLHLEVTLLVIPGLNDDTGEFTEMIRWIVSETGNDTVLHINRYFPAFRMNIPATPVETLEKLYNLAVSKLNYVYIGNTGEISDSSNTRCKKCNNLVIERTGYNVSTDGIDKDGCCVYCKNKVVVI